MRGGPTCSVPELKEKKMIGDEMFALHFGKKKMNLWTFEAENQFLKKKKKKISVEAVFQGESISTPKVDFFFFFLFTPGREAQQRWLSPTALYVKWAGVEPNRGRKVTVGDDELLNSAESAIENWEKSRPAVFALDGLKGAKFRLT